MLSLMLAGVMCLTIAAVAFAEGKLLTIWNAGTKLLFDTDNVTLTGHATFTYDGKLFKTFDGTYRQDGTDSYMQAMFDTPRNDGIYTGGYTVIANEGQAYAIDTNTPQYYRQNTTSMAKSILTNTVIRSSLMRFGGLLLDLMEERMAGAITETANENGTEYAIRLKAGEAPEIAGAAVTVLMQLAGKEYLYIDPQEFIYNMNALNYTSVEVLMDDWDALFAAEYEKAFGEAVPENLYDKLWTAEGEASGLQQRYNTVLNTMNALQDQYKTQYKTGVVIIQNDGSAVHYPTRHDYLIAMDNQMVYYDDADLTFRKFYEEKTGTPLSAEDMRLIWASNNHKLTDAYSDMAAEMWIKYRNIARENKASCIIVHEDGSYTLSSEAERLAMKNSLDYMTPARRILYSLDSVDIGDTDVVVQLDKEGRIASVSGTVTLITHDLLGEDHTLDIAFNGTAGHYGESEVETFDPAKYNVVSQFDYYNGSVNDLPAPDATAAPEDDRTVMFDGVEYKVRVVYE